MDCRICGNTDGNKDYYIKDYKYGAKNIFRYFQCEKCKCLQIAEIPGDMSAYYDSGYYSFEMPNKGITNKIRLLRDRILINGGGGILEKIFPGQLISFLAKNKFLSKNDKILDVGCGVGRLLFSLKENGFDKVLGIDPFLEDNIHYPNGLSILKKTIHELEDSGFNLIMLNHSFEHVSDPLETLESAERLLVPDGILLIRIPTVSSFAWNHHKEKWINSSAPEHFYLHSVESIRYLAEKFNLRLDRIIYDSTAHDIMPQYEFDKKNIILKDKRAFKASILNYLLNLPQIIRCQKIAEDLNAKNQGESCAFVLTKK